MITRKVTERLQNILAKKVTSFNNGFNDLSKRKQQFALLVFGVTITIVCVMLILYSKGCGSAVRLVIPDQIVMPYDIFMSSEKEVSEYQLTPVGKMKGEIQGEFESFYVAVDSKGSIYINRDIEYSERAYEKTDAWMQISREKLIEYERELSFIPSHSRGVRR
jgi:hypothetical protein